MRFLHTSDWHLGRRLHGVPLLSAQAAFLDQLVDTVRTERVDAVLVSGDVYDRAIPAPETVELLDDALARLVAAGATVIVTSGNHDSAVRLRFGSRLFEAAGVHIRSAVDAVARPVDLGEIVVHPLPYLEPAVAADPLQAAERTHAGVLRAAMAQVEAAADDKRPVVVMAHAFVAGAVSRDSERDISVGGVSAVPAEVFAAADVVALGHLHRRQAITETTRYSGSPVAMSFSEAGDEKGCWLWDVTGSRGAAVVQTQFLPAPVERPMAVLRGDLDDLLTSADHAPAQSAYCQVTLTDAVRPAGAMDRLRTRFPHTLRLEFDPVGGPAPVITSYAARVASRPPLAVCQDFLVHVRAGRGADESEQGVLARAVEQSRTRTTGAGESRSGEPAGAELGAP